MTTIFIIALMFDNDLLLDEFLNWSWHELDSHAVKEGFLLPTRVDKNVSDNFLLPKSLNLART